MAKATKPKSQAFRLLTDQALGEAEHGRGDGLGFDTYAEVLANAALGTPGPFTIGVFGEWGTGKTSLMKLIEQRLADQPDVVTVWFNAWQYEKEEIPIVPLVGTIIQEIERNKTFLKKLKDGGRSLVRSLRAIAYGFSASSEVQVPGFAKIEAGFVAKDMIDRDAALTPDPLIERSLYYSAFEALANAPLPKNARVVVLIDDLDRCFPDKAIRLLESIKLVLAQPGFIFVLGVARSVLEGYLQHRYQKEYGLERFEGAKYLDKIVQLAFPIPPHRGRMEDLADELIDAVDESRSDQVAAVIPLIAEHMGDNPRALVRFVNNLLIDVEIAQRTFPEEQEVPLEFFAISRCFQQQWSPFYDAVVFDRDAAQFAAENDTEQIGAEIAKDFSPLKRIAELLIADRGRRSLVESEPGKAWLTNHPIRERAVRFLRTTREVSESRGRFARDEDVALVLIGDQVPLLQKYHAVFVELQGNYSRGHQTYISLSAPEHIADVLSQYGRKRNVLVFLEGPEAPVSMIVDKLDDRGFPIAETYTVSNAVGVNVEQMVRDTLFRLYGPPIDDDPFDHIVIMDDP